MPLYRTTLYLLFLFSLVSASGHLRLELTASTNCHIRLTTDFSDETLLLHMGEKRITSFHPQTVRPDKIRVGLSLAPGGKMSYFDFALKNTGQQLRHLFEDEDLVVLIQSVYECNRGFYGLTCEFVGTPTTVATTTVTTTVETRTPTTPLPLIAPDSEGFSRLIITILLVIIISLTVLIIVFGILLLSTETKQQHIIFADTTKIPAQKKYKGDCIYEEIKEVRYTTAPFQMVEVGNWI
ncbi:hypothetical protein CRE_22850 [Caenorhabditis remanei]|uniref:Uncharacterized protein n=1 Tax=Caenorhabditis remanei TaxID=31234 RepID=E3MHJ2_CAERE|nr:hypothetical protein CRE_22850 [Caenorhabditis remanei]